MPEQLLRQLRTEFRSEAQELLVELDSALLILETEPGQTDLVHRVFRSIHTIKGSGATAGFPLLAAFCHRLEEAFDLAREGRLPVTSALIDCALRACDVIKARLAAEKETGPSPEERSVLSALESLLPDTGKAPAQSKSSSEPAVAGPVAYEIVFRPDGDLFRNGTDPGPLFDSLRELGQAHVTAKTSEIPAIHELDPISCRLWWEILLVTDRGEPAIREVFEIVEFDSETTIIPLEDQASAITVLSAVPPDFLELFVTECEDQLARAEEQALALERDTASRPHVDGLFRHIHTIKGNIGLVLGELGKPLPDGHSLRTLQRVAHALETLLEPCRDESSGITVDMVQTVLDTLDVMHQLVDGVFRGRPNQPISAELSRRLALEDTVQDQANRTFLNAAEQCIELIDSCLQEITAATASSGLLKAYARGLRTLDSAAAHRKLPELHEPVASQLRILEAAIASGQAIAPDEQKALLDAFASARATVERVKLDPPPLPSDAKTETEVKAGSPDGAERPTPTAGPSTIRIEQEKLDRLMRVVGELLVARGSIPSLALSLQNGDDPAAVAKGLKEAGAGISRIADELQASVMSIRMLPVRTVFQRFPRLVRDLARSLGKEVAFAMEGETIELDKTILEQIGDPLVHLIRNALDHGLETAEARRGSGKDPTGRLTLRAFHQAGSVVIEVVDDGKGLDAQALRRKAVDRGLIKPEAAATMTDEASYQLVFLPGLSTAAKVTDVSGRGVGMDVVLNNIRNLQGTIEIRSQKGCGATFSIKLPTSLMISKGILLKAAGEEFVIPLASIRDMVKLPPSRIHQYRDSQLVEVRGQTYAAFSLAETLGLTAKPAPIPGSEEHCVAIVEAGKTSFALLVDRFVSEVEVIVKPLNGGLEQCREYQGAAIMGDGRVVLVLNPLHCHQLGRSQAA